MSEELQGLLSRVFMNGLIERSWAKACGDVVREVDDRPILLRRTKVNGVLRCRFCLENAK